MKHFKQILQESKQALAASKLVNEGENSEYEAFFRATLKKFGKSGINDMTDAEKKEFFNYIEKNYTGEKSDMEESFPDRSKELNPNAELGTLRSREGKGRGVASGSRFGRVGRAVAAKKDFRKGRSERLSADAGQHTAAKDKEPGSVWEVTHGRQARTVTLKYGAKNKAGDIRYFKDERQAEHFARQ